jgi:alpha-galactosidase
MIKVAMIGAGSVVFSRNLTGDILGFPEFKDAAFSYMDVDADRLAVGAALCRKIGTALGATPTIEATTDRRRALDGADFVINMVQIGGFDSTLVDFEIPRKYGLNFTIADTTGPGGLFRALRTFPMLSGLCQDMMAVAPRATLLNYSNPMCMNMQTVTRTSDAPAVGLCHSVQGTFDQLMRYLGEDPSQVAFTCAGINHMAFYLKMAKDGVDLYPRLFAAMEDPKVYNTNKVRFELMRRLGYYVTESSEHNAEYSAGFIPHGAAQVERFAVPIDEYLRRCDGIVDEFERMKRFAASDEPSPKPHRSHEYGSTIVHSIATGTPAVVYGNMPNNGAISNLPATAIVEVPTMVDRSGLRLATVGELPPQLVGYMQPHVTQQELFIRAAIEGRRDHVYQAAMFDPLTAATLPPDKIVEMCDELIAAHGFVREGGCLPDLDAKRTLVPTSGKTFGRVDAKELRKSWDAAQAKANADYLRDWQIIGPFPSPEPGAMKLSMRTPVEDDFAKRPDGTVDTAAAFKAGDRTAKWKPATASTKNGFVDLRRELGGADWCVAYAYAEVESIHPRETVIRCGSDDGIQVWLNGVVVHAVDKVRAYHPGDDEAAVQLRAGVNRILVKVTNHTAGWGFGLAVPRATS